MWFQTQHVFWRLLLTLLTVLLRGSAAAVARPLANDDLVNAVQGWITGGSEGRLAAEASFGPIGSWDMSEVTSLRDGFRDIQNFQEDISAWDTSRIRYMWNLFYNTSNFSANISKWNTSNVVDMSTMLAFSANFSADLSTWDTSNVKEMNNMFAYTNQFNTKIVNPANFNTQNLEKMYGLFYHTQDFDGDIVSQWNTSKVRKMTFLFQGSSNFRGDLSQWDTSQVDNMSRMFKDTTNFGSSTSIRHWNTSKVVLFDDIFQNASAHPPQVLCWTFADDDSQSGDEDNGWDYWDSYKGKPRQLMDLGCNHKGFYLDCDAIVPAPYQGILVKGCCGCYNANYSGSICVNKKERCASSSLGGCDYSPGLQCCGMDDNAANQASPTQGCPTTTTTGISSGGNSSSTISSSDDPSGTTATKSMANEPFTTYCCGVSLFVSSLVVVVVMASSAM